MSQEQSPDKSPALDYADLNTVERRIVDGWVASGMTRNDALRQLHASLFVAEEDME